MKDLLRKYHKYFVIGGLALLFLIFGSLYTVVRYNLPATVRMILLEAVGADIKSDEINFKKGFIQVKNVTLSDKKGPILEAPIVEVHYKVSHILRGRIDKIRVLKPKVWLEIDNSDVNIVEVFTGDDEDKPKEDKGKKYVNKGSKVPIDVITVEEGYLFYRDITYLKPIEKEATNINGYVSFNKKTGIDLLFEGLSQGKRGVEKLSYSFNDKKYKYDMRVRLDNISVNDDLLQYAYDGEELLFYDGVVDLDLRINSEGLYGKGRFNEVQGVYKGIDARLTQGKGEVFFGGGIIDVSGNYKLGRIPGTLFIEYNDKKGTYLNFNLKDVNYKNLEIYDDLEGIDLPIEDLSLTEVDVNLNIDLENNLKVDIFFGSDEYHYAGFDFKNISGHFRYEGDEKFYLDDVSFEGSYLNGPLSANYKWNGDLFFTKDGGKVDFTLSQIESNSNLKLATGHVDLDFNNLVFKGELSSKILDLSVEYDHKKSLLKIGQSSKGSLSLMVGSKTIKNKSDLNLVYDLKAKKFLIGKGRLDVENDLGRITGDIFAINNTIRLNDVTYKGDGGEARIDGKINLDDFTYKVSFDSKRLNIPYFLGDKDIKLIGDFSGEIQGKSKDFQGDIKIKNVSGEYFLKFNNLEGDISVKRNGAFNLYFNGYLERLEYKGLSFYDFQVGTSLTEEKIEIKDFSNSISNIRGDYNFIKNKANFLFEVAEVYGRKIENTDIFLDIKKIQGKIFGEIEDISIKTNIDEARVILPKRKIEDSVVKDNPRESIKITGLINYRDKEVIFDKLKINESVVVGTYDVENTLYSFKINAFEENIPRYLGERNFRYRVMGEIYLWGDLKHTNSYVKASMDNIYLRGNKLPNLYLETSFSSGGFKEIIEKAVIDIRTFNILGENGEDLFELEADLDISRKLISFRNKTDTLDISKLSYLSEALELKGILHIDIDLKGSLDDFKYKFLIDSKSVEIGNIGLEELKFYLSGDNKQANLNEFSLGYEGNTLNTIGNINLKTFQYYLKVDSKDINLNFLNVFLYPFGLEDISGDAKIDLELKNKMSRGTFDISNLKVDIPNYDITIEKIDSSVKLNNERIYIDNFKGKINEGNIDLDGSLDIPDFEKMKNEINPLKLLNYSLRLRMKGVKYNYENIVKVIASSDLRLENNKITGSFTVNRGSVSEVPSVSKDDIKQAEVKADELGNNVLAASIDLGEDFAINTELGFGIEVDVNVNIDEGIFIKIPKVAPLVEELEAVVKGRGRLKIKNSRVQFLGELSSKGGTVIINGNTFEIEKVNLIFDDPEEYFPDVNPTMVINARTVIASEEITILVSGRGTDLDIVLSSASGLSQKDIASLLAFHNTSDSSAPKNAMVKSILDSQISRQLFNPVSDEVQRILRISKFRISSDIKAYEYQDGEYQESNLGLGARVEAENPIYKDKVYWNASARFADNSQGNTLDEYDFILEHRFAPSLSWGVGVGKVPEEMLSTRDDETTNLNYHIDFKFRKRYNNIAEIFIRK